MIFNYGTELVGINCHEKLGSTTIKLAAEQGLKKYEEEESREYYKNKKYVIVVRDILKRWKSGYLQDIMSAFLDKAYGWESHDVVDENPIFWNILNTKELDTFDPSSEIWKGNPNMLFHGLDTMTKIHSKKKDTQWMYLTGHSKFFTWTSGQQTLSELMGLNNVYFIELKDLGSVGFKKWLCSNDVEFEKVKFGHSNKKGNYLEQNIDLFWKEYTSGKIKNFYRMSDISKLRTPFWNLEEGGRQDFILRPYYELCKMTQASLDFIRKNHERYLSFEE
tara:strand:- start:374 stop:1204 length:831 start_codon:yes stop_codon:yes gene_type:complete